MADFERGRFEARPMTYGSGLCPNSGLRGGAHRFRADDRCLACGAIRCGGQRPSGVRCGLARRDCPYHNPAPRRQRPPRPR
jgi:hypothetical protein